MSGRRSETRTSYLPCAINLRMILPPKNAYEGNGSGRKIIPSKGFPFSYLQKIRQRRFRRINAKKTPFQRLEKNLFILSYRETWYFIRGKKQKNTFSWTKKPSTELANDAAQTFPFMMLFSRGNYENFAHAFFIARFDKSSANSLKEKGITRDVMGEHWPRRRYYRH